MRSRISMMGLWLGLLMLASPSQAQHQSGSGHHPRFDDPAKWSKTFDDPARDQWQMPDRIISELSLPASAVVADIGAGTGYFAARLARYLSQGTVFAVDLEKAMVHHLADRAKVNNLPNLKAVLGSETSPNLPEPVDVAILINVYHHIEGRTEYFQRLRKSLKLGGRVAIVDFRMDAPSGPPKHMRLPADQIVSEMRKAGYRQSASYDFLPRQVFFVFQPDN